MKITPIQRIYRSIKSSSPSPQNPRFGFPPSATAHVDMRHVKAITNSDGEPRLPPTRGSTTSLGRTCTHRSSRPCLDATTPHLSIAVRHRALHALTCAAAPPLVVVGLGWSWDVAATRCSDRICPKNLETIIRFKELQNL
ncbi:hypothetical protein Cni_G29306 [Canna indica]|uniref:Uncharacterized protein n=1 Tax=Canna indica TaxID=4628 RepID=A0AAQ3L8X1_9LILI|nr:hypothetical protein Cni_G29306 [Canna indica]